MSESIIHRLLFELKTFGILETFYHVKRRIGKKESDYANELIRKEKAYEKSPELTKTELMRIYKKMMGGCSLNLDNPLTFTEKIQWLKIYDCNNKTDLVDKYKVRGWIKERLGERYLIPILGVWNSFDEITFEKLPQRFVLKCNHGSGMNIIIRNNPPIDIENLKRKIKSWMLVPYEAQTLERQYKGIERRVIAEEYLDSLNESLIDYKIHCFSGKPFFIQCIGERNLANHTGKQVNYSLDWVKLDWIFEDYPCFECELPRPQNLDEMIEVASKLADGFVYVRVDLYNVDNQVLFGEMTFTPASGLYKYKGSWTKEKDLMLGSMIDIGKRDFGV